VTVGVDGSAGSAVALQWAVEHADHLGAIVPVMAFGSGLYAYGYGPIEDPGDRGGPYRSEAIDRLRAFLNEHCPSLADAGSVIEDRPGAGLVDAARASELLVVGTRGWSSRVDLSLGSVGAYCARHSAVPVALIPPVIPEVHDHLDVVVGFDGSQHARTALVWALTHLRRSAQVTVVRAYTSASVVGDPLSPPPEISETSASRELEDGVSAVLGDLPVHPPVELLVLPGDAREALRSVGADADVLVVGSRGHGVLDQLLLGSVAAALVHHPTVPTIVVPHHGTRTGADATREQVGTRGAEPTDAD
jgi:nucleotide-binding universal stress UspA family protein